MNQEERDRKKYYKYLNLTKVKNPNNIKDELLYQLFKQPKEKTKVHLEPVAKGDTVQADLLYLPHDGQYKYCLVVVDVGSRLTDAEPLINRTAKDTLIAIQKIFNRGIVFQPINKIVVDDGTEFKSTFAKYFKDNNVHVVVAQTNRKRQVGLVESRNKSIGDYLMKRMVAIELNTGQPSYEWVQELPIIIKRLNKRFAQKDPIITDPSVKQLCEHGSCDLLQVGQLTRFPLDYPIDVTSEKRTDSRFRSADVRYSLKPARITWIKMSPYNPPLYGLEGKHALYSRDVLIPVDEEKIRMPPTTQTKFVAEKITGKKTIDGLVHYQVKWENDKVKTYEPRRTLIHEIPDLIKEYEDSLKKKKN